MPDPIVESYLSRHSKTRDDDDFAPGDFNGMSPTGRLPWTPFGLSSVGPALMVQGSRGVINDVGESISSGDALAGLGQGIQRTVLGILQFSGVKEVPTQTEPLDPQSDPAQREMEPIGQAQANLAEANQQGTVTRSVLFAGTPYIAGGIATASGVTAAGGGLLAMLGTGMAVDGLIASVVEDPSQGNLGNLMVALAEANEDSPAWSSLQPVMEFLATDPEDPEGMNRLRNGAIEAMTNLFGEAVFGVAHLTRLKTAVDDGTLARMGQDALTNSRGVAEAADALLRQNPEFAKEIYGQDVTNISADLAMGRGAERYGKALDTLAERVKKTKPAPQPEPRVTEPVRMTPAEKTFFDEIMGNEVNRSELLEQVPSFQLTEGGGFTIAENDLQALGGFIDETVALEDSGKVPPGFRSNDRFLKRVDEAVQAIANLAEEAGGE